MDSEFHGNRTVKAFGRNRHTDIQIDRRTDELPNARQNYDLASLGQLNSMFKVKPFQLNLIVAYSEWF